MDRLRPIPDIINPIISNEIRHNFNNILKDNQPYGADAKMEIEVRFGHLNLKLFKSILNHLESFRNRHLDTVIKQITNKVIEIDANRVRKIFNNDTKETSFQLKHTNEIYDNPDWDIRLAKSYEVPIQINEFYPIKQRVIERVSYIDTRAYSYFRGFRIDLSAVTSGKNITYELELELIDNNNIPAFDKWHGAIKTLYGWMLNATDQTQIISLKERQYVIRLINYFMCGRYSTELDSRTFNRPITLLDVKDITTQYITVKLDGLHKILVADSTGTYLCAVPNEVVKVGPGIVGTLVMEGEFLDNTFFAFDLLTMVQAPLEERLISLYLSIDNLPPLPFKVKSKPFWIKSDWTRAIEEYVNCKYPTDGLIFQPLGPYNESTIWKWKPPEQLTVDFRLLQTSNKDIYVPYIISNNRYIRFGSHLVDSKLVGNLNGRIIECRWNDDHWVAIRKRNDKVFPNSFKAAESNWIMIINPITKDQLFNYLNSM